MMMKNFIFTVLMSSIATTQFVPIQDGYPLVGNFGDEKVNQDIVDFAVKELQKEKGRWLCRRDVKVHNFKSQV